MIAKNAFQKITYSLIAVWMCLNLSACSDDNPPVKPSADETQYCLMFYAAGGDPAHDLIETKSIEEAAAATKECDRTAVTFLIKRSEADDTPEHSGTDRYTAEDGNLVSDPEFMPGDDFDITSPDRLTDFIRWSAQKYPGRTYILVIVGHGTFWDTRYEVSGEEKRTRSVLHEHGKFMTSKEVADAIGHSGVALETLIMHSCLQGSIESIAEWESAAHYLVGSPFTIPDIAYDYTALIRHLQTGGDMCSALNNMAEMALKQWFDYGDRSITVTDLTQVHALWQPLRETFAYMKETLDQTSCLTDPPAIYGETYRKGYIRAFSCVRYSPEYEKNYLIDLPSYLRGAVVQSGNIGLISYVNRVQEVLDRMLVGHYQMDDQINHSYSILENSNRFNTAAKLEKYQQCRFDQLTGWAALRAELIETVQ